MKEKIESMKAPAAIGPYSQAVNNGGLVFVSGQLPIDCETGEFVSDDVSDQTRQSLENIKSILAEVGYDMDRILKTTVYLQDMNDFSAMNQVYETYFYSPISCSSSISSCKASERCKGRD